MKLLSTKAENHNLDQKAIAYGLSPETLMETAGFKASQWVLQQFPSPVGFQIFCGPGHNGGDGLVAAFYLKKAGRKVEVFTCKSSNELFQKKKKQAESVGLQSKSFSEWEAQKDYVLIDALFGVGLKRPLEGIFQELVLKINQSSSIVVALDVPSGLCADRGIVLNSAIKSHYTLCFALEKPGLYLNDGPSHSGKVMAFSIGFPQELLNTVCHSVCLIEREDAKGLLPSYKDTANKTDRGWSLIAAGREGMWGCGLLSCRAAYTVGSGYVTWASTSYPYQKSLELPEALLGHFKDQNLFDKKTAIGAGPGLGFSKSVENFILKLKALSLPVVLDADAITLVAKSNTPFLLNQNFLLTPHTGELSRLIHKPSQEISSHRLSSARKGAIQHKCWLLLKGFYPVLAYGEKSWIIASGHHALGKAGTGDVLTGLLTGLMAQGLSVFDASVLAVILQGETVARWLKQGKDPNSFSASEIINKLPFAMSEIRALNG